MGISSVRKNSFSNRIYVQNAVVKGGRVVVGGHRIGERFFAPTVIADANATMLCATEETFGPFAPVFRFHTEQEAIDAANGTIFGTASYLYSPDVDRILKSVRRWNTAWRASM